MRAASERPAFESLRRQSVCYEPDDEATPTHPSFHLSGAEGSSAKKEIRTEEDVLHLHSLPDFGGHLSAEQSELLLQVLLVPYLRIPFIVEFFAKAENVSALKAELGID